MFSNTYLTISRAETQPINRRATLPIGRRRETLPVSRRSATPVTTAIRGTNAMTTAPIATAALAALILAAFAQPSAASETRVGAEPHWSARIGTGQPFVTGFERQQARASSATARTSSATPRAASSTPRNASAVAMSRDALPSAHWTARIGTGRATDGSASTAVASSTAGVPAPTHWSAQIGTGHASPATDAGKPKAPAAARVTAKTSGNHPVVLVAQSWNSRGIDPNTFIVQHPAGSTWLNTPVTGTENATRMAAENTASEAAERPIRTANASNK